MFVYPKGLKEVLTAQCSQLCCREQAAAKRENHYYRHKMPAAFKESALKSE
jgi:hypothetical protein